MFADPQLQGALCAHSGADPELWDLDTHRHLMLGRGRSCWMCDEAEDVCAQCPVIQQCFRAAVRNRESFMIWAGYAWSKGRPVALRRRKNYA